MEDRPAEVVNNTACDTFDRGAYWEELETVGDAINEDIMNVEGGNFRAPTVPAHKHNAQFEDRPSKKNYDVRFYGPPFIKSVLLPELNASGNLKKRQPESIARRKHRSRIQSRICHIYLQMVLSFICILLIGSTYSCQKIAIKILTKD